MNQIVSRRQKCVGRDAADLQWIFRLVQPVARGPEKFGVKTIVKKDGRFLQAVLQARFGGAPNTGKYRGFGYLERQDDLDKGNLFPVELQPKFNFEVTGIRIEFENNLPQRG